MTNCASFPTRTSSSVYFMTIRILALTLLIFVFHPSKAQPSKMNAIDSAAGWRHVYLYGLAKTDPANIQLDSKSLIELFSSTGVSPAIASLALIDPKLVINSKGLTAWLFLFVKARVSDSGTLEYVAAGRGFSFVPAEEVRGVFGSHVNWPKDLLESYSFKFPSKRPFVLPFILPRYASMPPELSQSLVSSDGNFEVFGVAEFEEQRPEKLLAIFSALSKDARVRTPSR
jgi:hypothetical protein